MEEKKSLLLNYEKKVSKLKKGTDVDKLLFFPDDNVTIKKRKPKMEENEDFGPNVKKLNVSQFTHSSMGYIKRAIVQVNNNYKEYKKIDMSEYGSTIKPQKYEIDVEKGKSAKLKKLSDNVTPDAKRAHQNINEESKSHFFHIYDVIRSPVQYEWEGGAEVKICKRHPYVEKFDLSTFHLLMEVKEFKLKYMEKFGDLEPFFLTFTLFDMEIGKCVSEPFHVDLNSDSLIKKMTDGVYKRDEKTTLKKGVFHLKKRTNDIVMLAVIYKILEGNEDEVFERISEPEKVKDAGKVKQGIEKACKKFGMVKQAVAYSVMPVFNDEEELILGTEKSTFIKTCGKNLPRQLVDDSKKSSRSLRNDTNRIKTLDCFLSFEVKEINSYKPVHQGDDIIKIEDSLARNINEFDFEPDYKFRKKYKHYLYLNLYSCKINKKGLTGKTPNNITCRIQYKSNDKKLHDSKVEKRIAGSSSQELWKGTVYSAVSVHKKNPQFNDVFKIKLPVEIKKDDHLLLSFFQVDLKSNKGMTSVGSCWLKIIDNNGKLISGKQRVNILESKKNGENYFENSKKKRGVVKVVLHPDSTIYTHVPQVAAAFADPFNNIKKLIDAISNEHQTYCVKNLPVILDYVFEVMCKKCNNEVLSDTYLTLIEIVDKVAQLQINEAGQRNELLVRYCQDVFVNPMKVDTGYPYFQLTILLFSLIRDRQEKRVQEKSQGRTPSNGRTLTMALSHIWWFFDITVKSLGLYCEQKKVKRVNDEHFNKLLQELVPILAREVVFRGGTGLPLAKELNACFALFLRDCLDFIDRGLVLLLIDNYLIQLNLHAGRQRELIHELRMTFLEVIVDHEHFVPLCLPKKYGVSTIKVEDTLCDLQFLVGIVIREVERDLDNPEKSVRNRSFDLIKNLLKKHEFDSRYNSISEKKETSEKKKKFKYEGGKLLELVMGLYFPYVLYFVEKIEEYKTVSMERLDAAEKKVNNIKHILESVKSELERKEAVKEETQLGNDVDVGNIFIALRESMQKHQIDLKLAEKNYREEKSRVKMEYQHILFSIITILRHMNRETIIEWFKIETTPKITKFLKLLRDCVFFFEYRGKREIEKQVKEFGYLKISSEDTLKNSKALLEGMYGNASRAPTIGRSSSFFPSTPGGSITRGSITRSSITRKTLTRPAIGRNSLKSSGSTLTRPAIQPRRNQKTLTSPTSPVQESGLNTSTGNVEEQIDPSEVKKKVKWEGVLGSQVSNIVLGLLLNLIECRSKETEDNEIMRGIFDTLILFLRTNQSEKVLVNLFDLLKVCLDKFRILIYRNNTPYSEEIIKELLKKCYSRISKIRMEAAVTLYLVIKINYLENGNFVRTKTQTTTILNGLVAEINDKDIHFLKPCFKAIKQYSVEDVSIKNSKTLQRKRKKNKKSSDKGEFHEQVEALVTRLGKALSNSKKINRYKKEQKSDEKLTTLYLKMARGYKDSPELSVTWYETLSKHHYKEKRYLESGQCKCVMAGCSFKYLYLSNSSIIKKLDYSLLENCCPELKNMKFLELESLFKDGQEKPNFVSNYFTTEGMVQLIQEAISRFLKANFYEYVILLSKMLISYYENSKKFAQLSNLYHEVGNEYLKLAKSEDDRLFGSYYFVGYYGDKLEKTSGKEYIYKFPKLSRLMDVMNYVKGIYGGKFGEKAVKIKTSSFNYDEEKKAEKIDANLIYIKIIALSTYCDDDRESTNFNKNNNVNKFMYQVPFTKSGSKSHAKQIEDQWKRKNIIITKETIPSLHFRYDIVETSKIELTPIENSIEIVEQNVKKLKSFKLGDAVDVNTLQLVLSGTLAPQVQEGIPAIINCFLGTKYKSNKFLPQLESSMKEFLKYSLQGLKINAKYQSERTKGLHQQFCIGYKKYYGMISSKVTGCEQYDPSKHQIA